MSLRLYMDEHVHAAVTQGLRKTGIDVVTVQEDGRSGASDQELLDRATSMQRALFTQDTDLLIEAANRQAANKPFAGVIFAHQLRLAIGECIRDLGLLAQACDDWELANVVVYLPLG